MKRSFGEQLRSHYFNDSGFTIIEILMVIILVAIISVVSISVMTGSLDETHLEDTVEEMKQIKQAIIGNTALTSEGKRVSFGFLGDIGAIPTAAQGIAALVTNPALPAWAINAATQIGIGWNGPYLGGGANAADYTTDAWGNAYVYSPAAVPPTIVSLGSDGAAGGVGYAADITVTLPTELRTATVTGYISQNGAAFSADAEVQLNYPDGVGVLVQTVDDVLPAENGFFSFANIPMGVRSITIYIPDVGTATATNTYGPHLITVDKINVVVPAGLTEVD